MRAPRVILRPFETPWPKEATTPPERRKSSAFRTHIADTYDTLAREAGQLGADEVFVELDVLPALITQSGRLRSGSSPASGRVRVVMETRHGVMHYTCDRFSGSVSNPARGHRTDWEHNLRAIALGLEALRKVERYGMGSGANQYAGFLALPAGSGASVAERRAAVRELAAIILPIVAPDEYSDRVVDEKLADPTRLREMVKRARLTGHPDRRDGDRTAFDRVADIARLLGVE